MITTVDPSSQPACNREEAASIRETAHGSISPHVFVNSPGNGLQMHPDLGGIFLGSNLTITASTRQVSSLDLRKILPKVLPTDTGDTRYRVAATSTGAFVQTRCFKYI
ncbi:uncharacterized protein DFL_006003 [Arthrobotrys flagrans]|uniref:Uncharacterized protein n=1 Tax=Arthrobotrys flagrans TaxID=97331 RepID=A0A436ZZU4_ARTFL|nr:hypothetical protein DFL_006003 [Arthrobotrys flagrans]